MNRKLYKTACTKT